tara:strand:- start:20142 stop:21551 length:1410 start_codon:yes stop_codon:yes gene_type:complete
LDAATADVIDNAISAGASKIDIYADWGNGSPRLAIKDDGKGMSPQELEDAMRLGGLNSKAARSKTDLGRFGLGLKTASFSQCKSLSVISRDHPRTNWYGLRWNLSLIERENIWAVEVLPEDQCKQVLEEVDYVFESGAAVVWDDLDRVMDPTSVNAQTFFEKRIVEVRDHLGLTFHRFISGDEVKRVNISVNDHAVFAMDPFGVRPPPEAPASTLLSDEYLRVSNHRIRVRSYLLPHPSKLSHSHLNSISRNGDYHSGQGVYVYRAGRLILHGGWQRLIRASEANKLARVQVDFDNDSDDLWSLDVKKSRVELPATLRDQLKRVIRNVCQKSNSTFTKRAKMPSLDLHPIWERIYDRERNQIRYRIDRNHSLVKGLLREAAIASAETALLSLIEESLPVELIKNDLSSDDIQVGHSDDETELQELIESLLDANIDEEIIANTIASDSNFGFSYEAIKNLIGRVKRREYE